MAEPAVSGYLQGTDLGYRTVATEVLDERVLRSHRTVVRHGPSKAIDHMIAVALYENLHTAACDSREESRQPGLTGGVQMRLRVLDHQKRSRRGNKAGDDDWQCVRDSESHVGRPDELGRYLMFPEADTRRHKGKVSLYLDPETPNDVAYPQFQLMTDSNYAGIGVMQKMRRHGIAIKRKQDFGHMLAVGANLQF